jgi:3-phosphoshikimate 1-carboxyvinyltransferase
LFACHEVPCLSKAKISFSALQRWLHLDALRQIVENHGMTSPNNTPSATPHPATAHARTSPLTGEVVMAGDKSISHRALILSAMATGQSTITGLLEGTDVLATAQAMQALGAKMQRLGEGHWRVTGVGPAGLRAPKEPLDFGNSGTGVRLVMGVIAGAGIAADFIGDASLSRRPMARVTNPLSQMGAQISASQDDGNDVTLPLHLAGAPTAMPIDYVSPVASAQVKSAILLAGINTPGETTVRETPITRDHSENMLGLFGVQVARRHEGQQHIVTVTGDAQLHATDIAVPGDPSSAAFPMIAALCVPGSDIMLHNIMLNPQRDGLVRVLQRMGASIEMHNERLEAGERVADLRVRHSALHGVDVEPEIAASMIDEYPALAMAAACATGTTRMQGLHELRVKESDRLSAIADGLKANGVEIDEGEDNLSVHGCGPAGVPGGGVIETRHDHRIAMSFLVLGLSAQKPVQVDDTTMIDTSFPTFFTLMQELGVTFER